MRLPKKNDQIDIEETKEMVDEFLSNGFTYFDTAYVYDQGDSEKAIKEALVDRYPRDSYQLATKLNAWMGCQDEESAKQQFFTSLERTGAEYFDYYLLHALMEKNYKLYDDYHLWDFIKELKEKGLIKHYGFSYHSGPELLDKLLTEHPDVDFIQLQINYADWKNPEVTARENYEVARKHNKPIIIMEPIKGGSLANPIKEVEEVLKEADPQTSIASWAMRYAASLDGVLTVLSGMSNIEQMRDNILTLKYFEKLDKEQIKTIEKVQEILENVESIPCTGCHYCTKGCPQNIPIPEIFKARNKQLVWNQNRKAEDEYLNAIEGKGRASDCIECEQCEAACPQNIKVISWLKDSSKALDKKII